MLTKSAAAAASSATDSTPTTAQAEASGEPGLAELASIIGASAAPAPKAKGTNKPAPARPEAQRDSEDHDPELDTDDESAGDPTADAGGETATDDAGDGDDDGLEDDGSAGEEAGDDDSQDKAEDAEATAEESETESEDSGDEDEGEQPEGLDADDAKTRKALPPAAQKAFDKAIGKKVRQIREREQQIQELQVELAEAKANPPPPLTPTPDNPFAGIADETALDKKVAEYRQLRKWALTHPDGGTIKIGEKDVEVSRERVAEMIVETEELLQEHAPRRREWIAENRRLEQQAVQSYEWLGKKNTPGYVAVENMLRRYGNTRLRDIPGIRGDLADLFVGQTIRHIQTQKGAQQKGAAAGPGVKKPAVVKAPAVSAGGARPPKVAAAVKQSGQSSRQLEETGDDPGNASLGALIGVQPTRRS